MKAMHGSKLFSCPLTDDASASSFAEVVQYFSNVETLEEPRCRRKAFTAFNTGGSECSWKMNMSPVFENLKEPMAGLSLGEFV